VGSVGNIGRVRCSPRNIGGEREEARGVRELREWNREGEKSARERYILRESKKESERKSERGEI